MANTGYMGKIGRTPISAIADKCAEFIMRPRGCATAVCIDPDMLVTVEAFDDAVPDDIIGVYGREPGRLKLWRLIEEDLKHEIAERCAVVDERRAA